MQNSLLATCCNQATLRVVMATIAPLPGVRIFGTVWATLASLRGNLAQRQIFSDREKIFKSRFQGLTSLENCEHISWRSVGGRLRPTV